MRPEGLRFDAFLRGAIREIKSAEPLVALPRFYSVRVLERDMSKLSALTEALADTTKMLDGEADKVMVLLQQTNESAPKAFERATNYVLSKRQEVEDINAQLKQLTNLPLEGSDGSNGSFKKE